MMQLTDCLLARLRAVAFLAGPPELEVMIAFVSLRQAIICLISSGNSSQDLSYLISLALSNCCAFSARKVIASIFH